MDRVKTDSIKRDDPAKWDEPAWWDGWLCGLVVLLLFLAARPYVEMGLVDDFSYVKTAWVFAHTGRFVFNGWATAMLGWQIVWAAPFVRALGDTFFAVRVSITVLMIFTVVLTHAVMRRAGLNRSHAAFGALLVGSSPLMMPMSATFMTDVAGALVIVLCLYCALRALDADRTVLGWMFAGFAIGAVGGTARQIAWMAPLVMMPSAAWLLRRRRGVVALSVAMWFVSMAVMLESLHWFMRQPFHVPEPLKQGPLTIRSPRELAGTMLAAALCLALLLFPVLAESFPRAAKVKPRTLLWIAIGTPVLTLLCRFVTAHLAENGWLPWTGDIVERMDIFDHANLWMLGTMPVTWNHAARVVGSVVVIAALLVFAAVVFERRPVQDHPEQKLSWTALAILLGPFALAYGTLLMPRGIWAQVLDRYLLPLLILAALVVLRICQERISAKMTALPWITLAVFALWTVAGLHDWIASHRARIEAVQRVVAAGGSVLTVNAGYEFDGLTQIDVAGAVADPRVQYPAGFDTELHLPAGLPADCRALFQTHTPALRPVYFLGYETVPCTAPSSLGDVEYRRWLPPFRAQIFILKMQP
jgi:hypothetical protein